MYEKKMIYKKENYEIMQAELWNREINLRLLRGSAAALFWPQPPTLILK